MHSDGEEHTENMSQIQVTCNIISLCLITDVETTAVQSLCLCLVILTEWWAEVLQGNGLVKCALLKGNVMLIFFVMYSTVSKNFSPGTKQSN